MPDDTELAERKAAAWALYYLLPPRSRLHVVHHAPRDSEWVTAQKFWCMWCKQDVDMSEMSSHGGNSLWSRDKRAGWDLSSGERAVECYRVEDLLRVRSKR